MNHQQTSTDVNSKEPRLTISHQFRDGHIATYKLWRGHDSIDWTPKTDDRIRAALLPEFYEWYGSHVLPRAIECVQHYRQQVTHSKLVTENNYIVGWHIQFSDGLSVEVDIPHELACGFSAKKDGHDVSRHLNFEWWGHIVQAFVLRLPAK